MPRLPNSLGKLGSCADPRPLPPLKFPLFFPLHATSRDPIVPRSMVAKVSRGVEGKSRAVGVAGSKL